MLGTDLAQRKGGNVQYAVRTPDGRTLAVEEWGDPAGRPVLVHGGTPNSRHLYGPNVRDAAARGLRLLDDDGHLTLLQNRVPEVHAWLSEHLQGAGEHV